MRTKANRCKQSTANPTVSGRTKRVWLANRLQPLKERVMLAGDVVRPAVNQTPSVLSEASEFLVVTDRTASSMVEALPTAQLNHSGKIDFDNIRSSLSMAVRAPPDERVLG